MGLAGNCLQIFGYRGLKRQNLEGVRVMPRGPLIFSYRDSVGYSWGGSQGKLVASGRFPIWEDRFLGWGDDPYGSRARWARFHLRELTPQAGLSGHLDYLQNPQ